MFKIMIAVDGSEVSLEAVRYGIRLLQSGLNAHFVIAHVQKEASLLELATTDSDLIANASIDAVKRNCSSVHRRRTGTDPESIVRR